MVEGVGRGKHMLWGEDSVSPWGLGGREACVMGVGQEGSMYPGGWAGG